MANNDRVNDLYFRRIHSPAAQEACRERIHWLCAHVVGDRVLDIGCSQGIAPIILGREGRTVVGIDIEGAVIEAAEAALGNESQLVQDRVTFKVADAFAVEFDTGSFDTVILGELLEHLATPQRLLERVAEWLRPEGQIVVSVPHGYEPFDDHKRTFYLLRLVDLLAPRFGISEIEPVQGKYLCAVGRRRADGEAPQPLTVETLRKWVAGADDGLELVQRAAHEEKLALRAERQKLSDRGAQYREHIENLKQAEASLRGQMRARETELREAHAAELDKWRERSVQAAEREGVLKADCDAAMLRINKLESDLRAGHEEHQTLQREIDGLQHEIDKLRQHEQRQQGEKKKVERSLEAERNARKRVEGRVSRERDRAEMLRAELNLRERGVRYRLGDSFVRAARPSLDTLKLPFRFVTLLFEGIGNVRRRRLAARRRAAAPVHVKAASQASVSVAKAKPAKEVVPAPKSAEVVKPAAPPAAQEPAGLEAISTLAEPYSDTPRALVRRPDLCVAAVTDEFSWRAWQYEAELFTFTPKTWREALEQRKPDLLLVESAWSGLNDSWYFQIRDLGQRGEVIKYYAIPEIIAWCRANDVPTVFYNKEDPPNFDVFVEAAKQFDYVFTSDADCIPDYRKHVGHERVFALPFAAQPRIHNPIMTGTRTGSVCFAGTWYAHRHFARQDAALKVLRPGLDYDLHIFDRMANNDNPNFRWPDEFLPAVRGALPYAQMLAAYKRYKVFLNINSVTTSPTMFARRVFELLACGTPVISAYSEGIKRQLGEDIVCLSENEQTTREHLERLLSDDEYRERLSLRGQRKVFSEHTYTQRLQTILDAIGIKHAPASRPLMTMVAAVEDRDQVVAAWQNFARQEYSNKQLVLCARTAAAVAAADQVTEGDRAVRSVVAAEQTWGRVLREVVDTTPAGYLVACNPVDYYAPHYLVDLANATLYVVEPALGKGTVYKSDNSSAPQIAKRLCEYRVTSKVHPWTLCLKRDTAEQHSVRLSSAQTPFEWWNRQMREQLRIYATDRFNYVSREGDGEAVAAAASTTESATTAMELTAAAAC